MNKNNKRRLHFGVVFPSLDNTEKYNLLRDIENFAIGQDIHITAYFGTYTESKDVFASHYAPCFEAIRRSKTLDGVIIYSGFTAYNIGINRFLDYVSSISGLLPVVSIGMEVPGTYCVMSDNMAGTYSAVSHLINEDGKRRIAFIKGPAGHPEAEARFQGYLKALADNGIGKDESLILPGDFTPNGARLAMGELIDKRRASFDAICGCNDESALGAMRELKERGYSLPRDVAVIGYDDTEEAPVFKPALSSIRQDFYKLGTIAGETLLNIINGNKTDKVIYITPELIIRCSCGCNKKERHHTHYQDDARTGERLRRIATDNLLLEFNLDSLGSILRESLDAIALDFALIGVYRDYIKGTHTGDRSIDVLFGFDAQQIISIKNTGSPFFPFSDFNAVKDLDFERERHSLFFLPLFFGDEEIGTALIAYNGFNPINWYESLRTNIAAAVKGAYLLEKIQALSVTDDLTGLLNRRGFFGQARTRLMYLQREPEYVSVVFAIDMDGLKQINDTYGHAEGDNAITAFADILKESVRMGDITGRIGGDEFVIFTVVKSVDDVNKLESRIRGKFDEYNAKRKHPFNISGSIGTAVIKEPSDAAFDRAMLDADHGLYKEKQEKRKNGLTRS